MFYVTTLSVTEIISNGHGGERNTMTKRCLNDDDSGKLKYSVKGVSQRHFVHQKSHSDWPGNEFRPQKSQYGDKPPQSSHGL
jgi:hypothetical protein